MKARSTVSLDLPIRIQVPNGSKFAARIHDADVEFAFEDRQAPERPDGMRGEGIDDGKGTYMRSNVKVTYELELADSPSDGDNRWSSTQKRMLMESWSSLLEFLRHYAVVSNHLESTNIIAPEGYTLELVDPSTHSRVSGFPQVTGHVLPGPIRPMGTLTLTGVERLKAMLTGADQLQLSDELLVRAEAAVVLHRNPDQGILDTALSLEVFIDQLLDRLIDGSPRANAVRAKRRRGVYTAYDECMTVLGKTSLKDADRWKLATGETTAFELLEYIFVIRNNVTHRGVREFTPESLNTRRYKSDYLERHVAMAGIPISEAVVVNLIATAREIVRWMRDTNAP